MRITLLTNRDLASNYALNLLLPALSAKHQLRLFCSDRVGSQPEAPALATLSFYEQTLPMTVLFPLIDAQSKQGELLTFQGLNRYLTAPMGSLNQPNTHQGLDELAAICDFILEKLPLLALMSLSVRGVSNASRNLLNQEARILRSVLRPSTR